MSGVSEGFKVGFVGTPLNKYVHNLKSTDEHPQVVQDYIDKELQAGRIEGPFLQPPFPKYQMSPVGVVPKKASGEFSIIHNLSYPEGTSVNDKISSSACSVSYASTEDAIHLVKTSGAGSYIEKTDIRKAFRIVPLCPEDYCLFCFEWNGQFYFDNGVFIFVQIFKTFSTAIQWMAHHKQGVQHMTHILDDFFTVSPIVSQCQNDLLKFMDTCSDINVPMAPEKNYWPSYCHKFHGIRDWLNFDWSSSSTR